MAKDDVKVVLGDCLAKLRAMGDATVDLAYLDPPFFTNRHHAAVTRDRSKKFSFRDIWEGFDEYAEYLCARIGEVRRVLKATGSVFVHCDDNANFLIRTLLDGVFGRDQFRSEIVWSYKRWSNSAKGLMPSHQTIFFYSKTDQFKFHRIYCSYSETTNVDQILQLRARDEHGVSTYATDSDGNVVFGGVKKGVPLGDVWDIPFLNPKAKERVGYPTQKPVLLLERIISLCSDPGDMILDPFCGSGTTLVAAKLLGRRAIGVDSSKEAVELTRQRIAAPVKTESALMKKGRGAYLNTNQQAVAVLAGLDALLVQRNDGIDAFLKAAIGNTMVPVRVQRSDESLARAAQKLLRAATSRRAARAILIRTHHDEELFDTGQLPPIIRLVDATAFSVAEHLAKLMSESQSSTEGPNELRKAGNTREATNGRRG